MADLKNRRCAVERFLEDESITSDLTDAAAQSLLDWGLARVEAIAQQADGLLLSQEELNTRLTTLRRTMKRISRQAGDSTPEIQLDLVKALLAEIEMKQNPESENVS